MLCRACHVQLRKDFPYCLSCGTLRKGTKVNEFAAPELRWDGHTVPITNPETTVGRTDETDITIDDPSVSRRHARIVRDADGFHVEDLGSLNGTAVRTGAGPERVLHGGRAPLHDGTRVSFGDVEAVFGQPRTTAVGSKTQVRGTEFTMLRPAGAAGLPEEAATATEPLSARPARRSGWALKRVPSDRGAPRKWVLRNTRTGTYLSLDERQVFVWEHLDGEHTMRDLLFAYLERFGELALPRIEAAVRAFDAAGLVRGLPGRPRRPSGWRRFGRFLVRNLIRVQVAISGLDPLVERAYRAFGWRFFTRTGVTMLWLLTLGGLYGFWVATGRQQLFDLAGAGALGGVIVLVGYLVATAVHEAAHAFAVKSYGRRVNRGGFMVMLGMPFAFVDTSDMWFGSPYSRVVVALSGPLTTTGIAGTAALTAAYLPQPQVAGICYTVAFGLYVNTLFNLIPLMPLDGYQALADALRTPRLREEAKRYFAHGLWRDLRARRRPGPKQAGFVVFALLSGLCLYAGVALAVVMWHSRLGDLLRDHVGQPWRTAIVVAAIALLVFPIYYPAVRRVSATLRGRRAADARRAAAESELPAGAPAAGEQGELEPGEHSPSEVYPSEVCASEVSSNEPATTEAPRRGPSPPAPAGTRTDVSAPPLPSPTDASGYTLGVDLGTTFVAAALARGSQVEMFTLGDRTVVTPAAVYLREDGVLMTGEAAARAGIRNPNRAAREVKRRLGDPTPVVLGGSPHAVTELLSGLLRDVVAKVSAMEGAPPRSVLLTHPANWGPYRRGLFEEVPRLAGLGDTPMLTEPEAAAVHYAASRDLADGQLVAVYDLGGGTFDVTVLRSRPGGVEIVGTPEGIERLGGIDLDEAIFSHVDHVSGGALSELDPRDPRVVVALARLRQDCVLAKEALSTETETVLPVFLPDRNFDVCITRSAFEDLARAHIETTVGALARALRSAAVSPDELSAVLLVGGSSRIPLVAEMVSATLGRPTVVDTHPKYAVALGAAEAATRTQAARVTSGCR